MFGGCVSDPVFICMMIIKRWISPITNVLLIQTHQFMQKCVYLGVVHLCHLNVYRNRIIHLYNTCWNHEF